MSKEHNNNDMMDQVEMYVLGGLDRQEQEQFEAYMSQNEECRLAVAELREVVGFLPLTTELVEPPKDMKSRIMTRILAESGTKTTLYEQSASIGTEGTYAAAESATERADQSTDQSAVSTQTGSFSEAAGSRRSVGKAAFWRITTVVAAAAAILIGVYAGSLRGEIGNLQQQLAINDGKLGTLQQQLVQASMPTQGLRVNEAVTLSPATEDIIAQGLATIVIDNRGTHLLVQADNLPKLEGTQAFQVWLIKGDIKQSAGTFLTHDGTGAMYYTFKPEDYDTIAITLEPDGKGSQPRGEVILAANIADQG